MDMWGAHVTWIYRIDAVRAGLDRLKVITAFGVGDLDTIALKVGSKGAGLVSFG